MPADLSFIHRYRDKSLFPTTNRLGLHYFPDTMHYRDADLQKWLPELSALGISWIVLESETGRAIPENFISGLTSARIRPVIRFNLSTVDNGTLSDVRVLIDVYARWGAREVVFYDRPNDQSSWPAAAWAQEDLVERFLDRFVPLAEAAQANGITPIFPPLQPGGSYWDTAFLRTSLQSLLRRKLEKIATGMGISAYAWTHDRPLDWGKGGPDAWPRTRPYITPPESQDQQGFRIFDWYQAIIRSVLRTSLPIYLFQTGQSGENGNSKIDIGQILSVARLLTNDIPGEDAGINNHNDIPVDVVCGAFWLLSADPSSPFSPQGWYDPEGNPRDMVAALSAWRSRSKISQLGANRIKHYLLLPTYDWGIDEVHLEVIRPFLRKHRPAVGFSIDEAVLADCVTVIGDESTCPEEALNRLRQAGCRVERIQGDGTTIASLLAER